MSEEKRLMNTLMKRYERIGKGGRPVLNASTAVNVSFGLGLIQMDLNEKEKILTMSMWTRHVSINGAHSARVKNRSPRGDLGMVA
jgi:hypothetical protein